MASTIGGNGGYLAFDEVPRGTDALYHVDSAIPILDLSMRRGDSSVDGAGNANPLHVFLGKGDDTVRTGSGDDIIFGGKGNDDIDAGNGHTFVVGSPSRDTISAGHGDGTLRGGKGDDEIWGDGGQDFLAGDDGNGLGNGGADTLDGGKDDDF